MEEWKDVEGWEGIYRISNHGRLKSFKKKPGGVILSNKNKTGDYLSVVLCKKGLPSRYCRIHVLVAEAFVQKPAGKVEINHKDLNKQNNNHGNIEWVTRLDNVKHAVKNKPGMVSGMRRYNQFIKTKPMLQISKSGETLGIFPNAVHASNHTGVCARNIIQVAAQTEYKPGLTRKQAGGYVWRYMDVD
jgi:hypothetical protein